VEHRPEELEALLESHDYQFAVVDLKLGTGSGLTCVQMLAERDPKRASSC
jgi:two-component system response regulator RegA